ncbi:MAG TPA: hypothetical protein VNZ52_15035, partial [Candidatus Thermoplasmatota archaeon]|nr:hypothetical protein [Candidatus Thermoplasmatota archaeon]
ATGSNPHAGHGDRAHTGTSPTKSAASTNGSANTSGNTSTKAEAPTPGPGLVLVLAGLAGLALLVRRK